MSGPEHGFEVEVSVPGPDELAAWLDEHATGTGRVGLAVHGTWGRGTGTTDGLALAAADGSGAFVDPVTLTEDDERALAAWLADPDQPKALHDAKGPMHALAARGLELGGLTNDTALAAYLALPGQRSFDLADLVLRYLGKELRDEGTATGQLAFDLSAAEDGEDDGEAEAAVALVVRARATAELADALDADLEQRGAAQLLADVELPLVGVLARMERAGIAADTHHFADMSASLGGEVKAAEQAAFTIIGHEFNLGSPKQLQEVLFTELGLPKTKRIKTGYTTDSEALTSLLAQTGHPVLEHLLRHRDVARLKSIVDSLIPMADEDGRIHTTYNQMIAATGRLSSTDPNLQNIPIRTEEGRRIRQGFVVGDGYETLLTADYSQIELRIMADLSGDTALEEAFTSGHDFHAETASRVFGVPPEEVTVEMRSRIKAMNYGLAYGLSAYGLSQQLRITPDEARALMDEYFQQFGGIRDYLYAVVDEARKDGYTQTVLGRRRYLPDLTSDNRQRREMAERMALNAPIQGSAADIIKVAMLRVDQALRDGGPALPDAAPGARRAGLRGRPRRARHAARAGAPDHVRRFRPAGAAAKSRSAPAAPGLRPGTECWPGGDPPDPRLPAAVGTSSAAPPGLVAGSAGTRLRCASPPRRAVRGPPRAHAAGRAGGRVQIEIGSKRQRNRVENCSVQG